MMSQFILGLFAGIVVGLVMEWVIDWAGLLPQGMMPRRAPQTQAQGAAMPSARADQDEQIAEKATISPSSSQSKSGE